MTDWAATGEVFSFVRSGAEVIFCAFNLGKAPAMVRLPEGRWEQIGQAVGSIAAAAGEVQLPGWGCCIARKV
jgi:alpha-glucosidase